MTLDAGSRLQGAPQPHYVESGHLVFFRRGGLFAAVLALRRRQRHFGIIGRSSLTPRIEEVDRLNEKASQLISKEDPRQMLELGEKACDLARRISYKKGEAYGLVYHWFLSDHSAEG